MTQCDSTHHAYEYDGPSWSYRELAEENARNERAAKKRKCLEVVPLENQDFKSSRVLEPCRGIKAFQEVSKLKYEIDIVRLLAVQGHFCATSTHYNASDTPDNRSRIQHGI